MTSLLLAALFLLASHFGLSSTPLRPWLVARIGLRAYLGLYSLIALVAVVWLVVAYGRAAHVPLWPTDAALRWLAVLVMPFAFLLAVAGVLGPNPTAVGQARALEEPQPVRGMLRITRHPLMWGLGLWAILHLLANGDLASVLFFGAFATLALVGTVLIDTKRAADAPEAWQRFLAKSSSLPLLAILQGRQKLVAAEIGAFPLALALVLYLALLLAHPWLFGVPAVVR